MKGNLANAYLSALIGSFILSSKTQIVLGYERNLQDNTQSFCAKEVQDVSYFCPVQRYCSWENMENDVTGSLEKDLKYEENSWNYNNAINEGIEYIAFLELKKQEMSALQDLGFDEDSHDCCHGHYEGYDWSDFATADFDGVRAAWGSIGYDEIAWTTDMLTEFYDYWWDELSEDQRSLLSDELCYTRELWNGIPMSAWPEGTMIPGTDEIQEVAEFKLQPDCRNESPDFEYFCPLNRYCNWDSYLEEATSVLSRELSYDDNSWNYVTENEDIEAKSYFELNSRQIGTLNGLGYTGDSHDCCQVHYDVYDWSDFSDSTHDGVRAALELIGYDEILWNAGIVTEDAGKFWDNLSEEQRSLLSLEMCYTKETWDGVIIPEWPDDVEIPGSRSLETEVILTVSPTNFPTPSPTDSPTSKPTVAATTGIPTFIFSEEPTTIRSLAPEANETFTLFEETSEPSATTVEITDEPTLSPTEHPKLASASPSTAKRIAETPAPTVTADTDASTIVDQMESKESDLTANETISTFSPAPTPVPINITDHLTPCRDLDPDLFYYCPPLRYCAWEGQPVIASDWLTNQLGYERTTWNLYSQNPAETSWFEDLPLSQQRDLESFGFDIERHECCMNHYENYGWRMFDRWNMTETKAAWETLGYDEEKWNNGLPTEFDDLWFDELPEAVQTALTDQLCYTEELWNAVPLDFWPEDATLPGTYDLSVVDDYYLTEEDKTKEDASEDEEEGEEDEEESAASMLHAKFFTNFVIYSAAIFMAIVNVA